MIAGRLVWGAACVVLLGLGKLEFSWQAFLSGAVLSAIPGIVLQLLVIPAVMVAMDRTGLVPFRKREAKPAEEPRC